LPSNYPQNTLYLRMLLLDLVDDVLDDIVGLLEKSDLNTFSLAVSPSVQGAMYLC
jgi:hypothetical protein